MLGKENTAGEKKKKTQKVKKKKRLLEEQPAGFQRWGEGTFVTEPSQGVRMGLKGGGGCSPRTFDVAERGFRKALAQVDERPLGLAAREPSRVGRPDPLRCHLHSRRALHGQGLSAGDGDPAVTSRNQPGGQRHRPGC